jgi:succinate dehydrogenase / fumarate reductase cytochrome b subunit
VKARPKNLNLTTIRLPLPALVSILHRLSGVLLFLTLPFLLWAFEDSLASGERYEHMRQIVNLWPMKVLLLVLAWAFLHHSMAGARLLFFDVRTRPSATRGRRSSKVVLGLSLSLTLLIAVGLW